MLTGYSLTYCLKGQQIFKHFLVWFVALLGVFQLSTHANEGESAWLKKDFSDLTSVYAGQWDNDRHVFFAKDAGIDLSTVPSRVNVENSVKTIESEKNTDGASVNFKVRISRNGENTSTRSETFAILFDDRLIRQKFFIDDGLDETKAIDCIVDWKREGSQFKGSAKGSECSSVYPVPSSRKKLTQTWMLSEQELWIVSQKGAKQIETRLRRVRPFECWVSILRGASHGDSGIGQNNWDFRRGIKIHDQGGEAELMTDESPQRKIRLVLRDVDWPYGRNRPSLVLYVMEGDNDRAVSYSWGEGGAERIGINLRWMQASCTHTPASDT